MLVTIFLIGITTTKTSTATKTATLRNHHCLVCLCLKLPFSSDEQKSTMADALGRNVRHTVVLVCILFARQRTCKKQELTRSLRTSKTIKNKRVQTSNLLDPTVGDSKPEELSKTRPFASLAVRSQGFECEAIRF